MQTKMSDDKIKEIMLQPYCRVVTPISDESGTYYVGRVLEFDGCMTTGDTAAEAYSNLEEAMIGWLEVKLENGDYIPDPLGKSEFSGKFVLRLPISLHQKLAMEAKLEGVSLNQYALYKLAK